MFAANFLNILVLCGIQWVINSPDKLAIIANCCYRWFMMKQTLKIENEEKSDSIFLL